MHQGTSRLILPGLAWRLSRRRAGVLLAGGFISAILTACVSPTRVDSIVPSSPLTDPPKLRSPTPGAIRAMATRPSPTLAAAPSAIAPLRNDLTIFAAASLTDAFNELGRRFATASSSAKAKFAFGGSSQLVAQLAQGARADVFASADPIQMKKAVENGSITSDPRVFATNRLTIIVPRDNPARIRSLADLARPGLKFITVVDGVPIGTYTQQVLKKASQNATLGPDFADRVNANIVSHAQDVRQAVATVALGEGDASIVYTSDVTPASAAKLATIAIPDAFNVIAEYPIAIVRGAVNPADAERFIRFILAPEGQEILVSWGFGRVDR